MALATAYRPETFDEIVGNDDTIKSLISVLDRKPKDLPHAFLITGPRGCGKTTIGRIIRNELECADSDYHEVDSADFRGVDTVRGIRQHMAYSPSQGKCRVWLLDECHQMTNDAQSALLKALEDTPDHVFFILCTTDPQKLLPTIKSRCVQFEVQPLCMNEMEELLTDVVKAEKKKVPKNVIAQIARDSMGISRDALQVLDKIIDLDEEDMLACAEKEMAKENKVIDLCRALIEKKKWGQVAEILKSLEKEDPERTRLAIMGYSAGVLLSGKFSAQAFIIMDCFREPLFNNGRAGLVLYAYDALVGMPK